MRTTPARRDARRDDGSALLPMVAAMLIMVLTGVALSETFGAQRMESVFDLEATRARWIAEAGLWHAVYEEEAISTPVAFGGGTYVVSKDGGTYESDGARGEAARSVIWTEDVLSGPIDVPASIATLEIESDKKFEMNLVSIWPVDLEIESFELSDDQGGEYEAHRFKLDNKDIWHEHGGEDIPTGVVALSGGCGASKRTIEAWDDPVLLYQSHEEPDEPVTYTLVLHFTDGQSSTFHFTVVWEEEDEDDDDDDDDDEDDD